MSEICLLDLLKHIEKIRVERSLGPMIMLRNYDGLPATKPGNDIDLVVRPSELEGWQKTFEQTAKELSIAVKETLSDYYFKSYVFVQASGEVVKIDLNFSFVWRGAKFADIDQVVDSAKVYSAPIFVASKACDRAFITFCHSFLYGGYIKRQYISEFAEQLREGLDFYTRLENIFGRRNAGILRDQILSGQTEMSRRQANAMRLEVLARAFARQPVTTAVGFVRSLRGPVGEMG